jgi:hypothetical protein
MPPPPERRPFYRSLAPLLIWQQLPRPVDWSAVFGRRAPLEVEIGIGSGEYIARNAAARPDVYFVGVDLRWASVKRALRNLAARPADAPANVRLVMEDAKPVRRVLLLRATESLRPRDLPLPVAQGPPRAPPPAAARLPGSEPAPRRRRRDRLRD